MDTNKNVFKISLILAACIMACDVTFANNTAVVTKEAEVAVDSKPTEVINEADNATKVTKKRKRANKKASKSSNNDENYHEGFKNYFEKLMHDTINEPTVKKQKKEDLKREKMARKAAEKERKKQLKAEKLLKKAQKPKSNAGKFFSSYAYEKDVEEYKQSKREAKNNKKAAKQKSKTMPSDMVVTEVGVLEDASLVKEEIKDSNDVTTEAELKSLGLDDDIYQSLCTDKDSDGECNQKILDAITEHLKPEEQRDLKKEAKMSKKEAKRAQKEEKKLQKQQKKAGQVAASDNESDIHNVLFMGRERHWSYIAQVLNKRAENFLQQAATGLASNWYNGIGFSTSGIYFEDSRLVQEDISGSFLTSQGFAGINVKFGNQIMLRKFYFATELNYNIQFAFASALTNGQETSISFGSEDSIANGSHSLLGLQFKPGFNVNHNKGSVYTILGAGYHFASGQMIDGENTFFQDNFSASGFGLLYGFGFTHQIKANLSFFADFYAMPSIASNGAVNLDRGFYLNNPDSTIDENINPASLYYFNVGLNWHY